MKEIKKEKKLVSAEKTIYTFSYLRQVSWHTFQEAKKCEHGSYLNLMVSLVFSAFTLEAYLNHLGEIIIPFWKMIERNLSPYIKLEIIAAQLGKQLDYGKRPFQSFHSIFRFRDMLAHGKTENLIEENIQFLGNGELPELPKTKWQEYIKIEIVQSYFDDTKEMIEYLDTASGQESSLLYVPEMGSWHIGALPENE